MTLIELAPAGRPRRQLQIKLACFFSFGTVLRVLYYTSLSVKLAPIQRPLPNLLCFVHFIYPQPVHSIHMKIVSLNRRQITVCLFFSVFRSHFRSLQLPKNGSRIQNRITRPSINSPVCPPNYNISTSCGSLANSRSK